VAQRTYPSINTSPFIDYSIIHVFERKFYSFQKKLAKEAERFIIFIRIEKQAGGCYELSIDPR
jgi:hypothetical protein